MSRYFSIGQPFPIGEPPAGGVGLGGEPPGQGCDLLRECRRPPRGLGLGKPWRWFEPDLQSSGVPSGASDGTRVCPGRTRNAVSRASRSMHHQAEGTGRSPRRCLIFIAPSEDSNGRYQYFLEAPVEAAYALF